MYSALSVSHAGTCPEFGQFGVDGKVTGAIQRASGKINMTIQMVANKTTTSFNFVGLVSVFGTRRFKQDHDHLLRVHVFFIRRFSRRPSSFALNITAVNFLPLPVYSTALASITVITLTCVCVCTPHCSRR